jgi:cytochrome c peroxidase
MRSTRNKSALRRAFLVASAFSTFACRHDTAPQAASKAVSKPSASASTSPASIPPAPAPSSATARAFYADRFSKRPYAPDMMALGRALFFDPQLSASGKLACSSCHDPRFAYGPADARSTERGGAELGSSGLRAVPSLRYLQKVPRFSEHYFDEAVDESVDQGPTGGHTWDGRADTLHDQARLPLTSALEMANPNLASVVAKVEQAAYAERFRQIFGADVFAEPARAEAAVLLVLEVFQQNPKDFYPYSSRYDAYLRHKGELTLREARGLELFDDPHKGNCAHCHPSQIRAGSFPDFTDFGFAALGVPRNRSLERNADPKFFDLGLCGPLRTDLAAHREYCGAFRAPSLRNAALRRSFFHNGVFHDLKAALRFYAGRDSSPAKFYPHGQKFDDLPAELRDNVNREAPFGAKPPAKPALSDAELDDIIVFLGTLTDADLTGERDGAAAPVLANERR